MRYRRPFSIEEFRGAGPDKEAVRELFAAGVRADKIAATLGLSAPVRVSQIVSEDPAQAANLRLARRDAIERREAAVIVNRLAALSLKRSGAKSDRGVQTNV